MNLTPQQIAELTVDEITRAISLGTVDKGLHAIEVACKRRQAATVRTFQSGERVKLVKVTPQYLVGLEGTVEGIGRKRIEVKLDYVEGRNYGKFEGQVRMGMAVGVTPEMVERI